MKLIYSKTTKRYILIAPINFNFNKYREFKEDFAKLNNIPSEKIIILPNEDTHCIDVSSGYAEI